MNFKDGIKKTKSAIINLTIEDTVCINLVNSVIYFLALLHTLLYWLTKTKRVGPQLETFETLAAADLKVPFATLHAQYCARGSEHAQ